IYHKFNFERDKPELLTNIGRNKLRNPAWASEAQSPVTSAAEQGPSPKKVKLLPTRRSPRLHKTGEDDVMSQQGVPNNQTPADNLSTVPSSALEKSQHPCKAPDNCAPQETCGPCGEGMSDKDTVSPLATVKMEGAGHMPSSSSGYLAYGYMMSMYNTCRSILKAALSAVSLSVSAEEEEEQKQKEEEEEVEEEEGEEEEEEYSENTCIICVLFNQAIHFRDFLSSLMTYTPLPPHTKTHVKANQPVEHIEEEECNGEKHSRVVIQAVNMDAEAALLPEALAATASILIQKETQESIVNKGLKGVIVTKTLIIPGLVEDDVNGIFLALRGKKYEQE
ncbi:hypothetical protein A6R68_17593, partial [Neotoma lepida]